MRAFSPLILLCSLTSLAGLSESRLRSRLSASSANWKPEDLIPESYNKLKAPANGSKPCDISISLNITQILGVNEADEVGNPGVHPIR